MTFSDATRRYETWLARHLKLVAADLKLKHKLMRGDVFPFFRATFYRWAQLWPEVSKELAGAPPVLAVGDLHVENFGTWRDAEGRLVWGVNDFDEAWTLPYTNDLVRLAASAGLAGMKIRDAGDAILAGYRDALNAGGRALVLSENQLDLRTMAAERLKDPGRFWRKLESMPEWKGKVPKLARKALVRALGRKDGAYRIVHRVAGLGSLGRQRFVALAESHGGFIAREAKALAPSASAWASKRTGTPPILYQELLGRAVRCPDPFVTMKSHWIVRRLAPDCSRIELLDLPRQRDESRLLYYMGWETANVHLGSPKAKAIPAHLKNLKARWLENAAARMAKATKEDWKEWRRT
jgi:hypothetical protein